MSTVWVLGAGFSQPLGGPLLWNLFTQESQRVVRESFRNEWRELYSKPCQLGLGLYQKRERYCPGQWSNAEQYLDQLDSAANQGKTSVMWKVFSSRFEECFNARWQNETGGDLSKVSLALRSYMAAECSAFVRNADTKTERWEPFTEWARNLPRTDVVVTFNYDLVLETLNKTVANFDVLRPGSSPSGEHEVLKLHGSVNWEFDSTTGLIERNDAEYITGSSEDRTVAIAGPGTSKRNFIQNLEWLWNRAIVHLHKADRVVFVGYRFPETDRYALNTLLRALSRNKNQRLICQIVLGPERNKDVRRLEGLLQWTILGREATDSVDAPCVQVIPMWSQDFLAVESMKSIGSHE